MTSCTFPHEFVVGAFSCNNYMVASSGAGAAVCGHCLGGGTSAAAECAHVACTSFCSFDNSASVAVRVHCVDSGTSTSVAFWPLEPPPFML